MFVCANGIIKRTNSKLNPYEYAMLIDFELCSVYAESAEIEKWFILSTKEDNVEYSRKTLPLTE